MKPEQIKTLRTRLGLKQPGFGQLFGVHPITVSKWERGLLSPSAYQESLMDEFSKAAKSKEVKATLAKVLIGAGIAAALFLLLKNARK